MDKQNITLISYGDFEIDILKKISEDVTREFNCSVNIKEFNCDLSKFYDPARRQYNANEILKEVDSKFSSESLKVIGLFRIDLFIPILTYIFGQAYLSKHTGIMSTYRLDNELYGIAPDKELFLERFRKEVIHELGHTFGLIHCHNPTCVMRSSTYVEDIDQKSVNLCPKCRKEKY